MPKHAVKTYGPFIRQALSKCPEEAEVYAKRLSGVLEGSWSGTTEIINPVNILYLLSSFKPRSFKLTEIAEDYLALKEIDQIPPRVALLVFTEIAGDRDVSHYTREDTKLFVLHLTKKGNKTKTIRRRINSLSAILNYACSELDLDKRNPSSRLIIKGERDDSTKHGVFTNEQLKQGYDKAINSGSQIKVLMPMLGETGYRLAEIGGLRLADIDLENDLTHIHPNPARRLKTKNSQRVLPLVGYAKLAMEEAIKEIDGEYLFPRYIKEGKCKADHASAALKKWLKKDFGRLTAHCLRHTFRDRVRAVECTMDMIDQIGGWKSVSSMGKSYGQGYSSRRIGKMIDKFKME